MKTQNHNLWAIFGTCLGITTPFGIFIFILYMTDNLSFEISVIVTLGVVVGMLFALRILGYINFESDITENKESKDG